MPESLYSASHPHYELKYILPYMHFGGRRCDVYPAAALSDSGLSALLQSIYDERRRADYGYEMALRAYVSQVLLWFIRAWNRSRDAAEMDERALVRLQRALDYIDEHLDEPLRAADVASALGMGLSTFSRFFTSAAGMSLPAYVRDPPPQPRRRAARRRGALHHRRRPRDRLLHRELLNPVLPPAIRHDTPSLPQALCTAQAGPDSRRQ